MTTELLMVIAVLLLVGLFASWGELRKLNRLLRVRGSVSVPPEQTPILVGDDPLVDMLHRALGNRTGKLWVADAYRICGIEPGKVNQEQISRFGRAIRELGWERQRRRFGGALQYAYVKGTAKEREAELIVEYDPNMRSVRIEVAAHSSH